VQELPHVISINISKGGIPKHPVKSIRVLYTGLEGDGHNHEKHYRTEQAVSIQDIERLEELSKEGYSLLSGTTGENLTVKNLKVNELPVGTILKISQGLIIELTKARKPCYVLDAIDLKLKEDIINRCGMYARVVQEGAIQVNDVITVERK